MQAPRSRRRLPSRAASLLEPRAPAAAGLQTALRNRAEGISALRRGPAGRGVSKDSGPTAVFKSAGIQPSARTAARAVHPPHQRANVGMGSRARRQQRRASDWDRAARLPAPARAVRAAPSPPVAPRAAAMPGARLRPAARRRPHRRSGPPSQRRTRCSRRSAPRGAAFCATCAPCRPGFATRSAACGEVLGGHARTRHIAAITDRPELDYRSKNLSRRNQAMSIDIVASLQNWCWRSGVGTAC
eukprot:COSAG04_NODE_427_length_14568_cov_27.728039_6_plen_244_part_00